MTEPILSFTGKYNFLSNFYPSQVRLDGVVYPTLEHAFQAAKVPSGNARLPFKNAPTAGKAKYLGRSCSLRSGWETAKFDIMLYLVRDKFSNPVLRTMLLSTWDAYLQEGNTHGDHTWGTVNNVGENWLGRMLMKVRDELQPTLMQQALEALKESVRLCEIVEQSPSGLTFLREARQRVTEASFLANKALSFAYNDAVKAGHA